MAGILFYVDSVSGSDSNTGGISDPFLTIPYSVTQMGDFDTLVVNYAGGTPYVLTSQLTLSSLTEGIQIEGRDTAGVRWGASPETYDRTQLPIIEFNYTGSNGIEQTHLTEMGFRGLSLRNTGSVSRGFYSATTNVVTVFEGCEFRDFATHGAVCRESTFRECLFVDCPEGCEFTGTPMILESCIFVRSDGFAIDRFNAAFVVTVRNCTFYNCSQTTPGALYVLDGPPDADWTVENCLFVDGYSGYGLPGTFATTSNCYRSDGGTVFHDLGNYNGATDGANDFELDPEFTDAANLDFHVGNNLKEAGTANAVARLFDGTTMPATPPIGALGATPPSVIGASGFAGLTANYSGGFG